MKICGAHQRDPYVLRNMISCSFILFEIFKHLTDGKHLNMFGSGSDGFSSYRNFFDPRVNIGTLSDAVVQSAAVWRISQSMQPC